MAELEAPVSAVVTSGRFKRRRKRQDGEPTAVDLMEEGIHLLRQTSLASWTFYVCGMAPFILGFLFFWTEMASSGLAEQVLVPGSIGVALLFLWCKLMQVRFARVLREALHDQHEPEWSAGDWLSVLRRQAFWQSTGLFVLPIAFVITLPFAWISAFYQNLLVANPKDEDPNSNITTAHWQLARIWTEQNWVVLSLLMGVFILSFINFLTVIFFVPYLLKTLLGLETVFSRAGVHLFNSTTLISCLLLSYAVTDPLFKAVYCIRLHYCASRKSGADMLLRLRRTLVSDQVVKGVLTFCLFTLSPLLVDEGAGLHAQSIDRDFMEASIEPDTLDASIQEVFQRREFVWRFPREEIETNAEKPEWLESLGKTLKTWQEKVSRWFEKLLKSDRESDVEKAMGDGWEGFPGLGTFFSYLLIALFVLCVIYFGIRAWKMYQPLDTVEGTQSTEPEAVPDLNEEEVAADLLPRNRWVELARELIAKGEFRLALRAYFLAQLSALSSEGLIVVRKSKSNREYAREIASRAHGKTGLIDIYRKEVRLFESVWYGERITGPAEISEMESHLEEAGVLS